MVLLGKSSAFFNRGDSRYHTFFRHPTKKNSQEKKPLILLENRAGEEVSPAKVSRVAGVGELRDHVGQHQVVGHRVTG